MARRNRNKGLLYVLMESLWWVSVVCSGAVYFGLKHWLPSQWDGSLVLSSIAKRLEPNAGLFAFILLVPVPISLIRSLHRRKLLDNQSAFDSIQAISWQQFEMLCGETYRRKGFSVEENGLGGADGGIDLILRSGGETWLVQCKRWKTFKVGVREVRELYGILTAERAQRGIFITCGQYTQDALTFAADKPLNLVDGRRYSNPCARFNPIRSWDRTGRPHGFIRHLRPSLPRRLNLLSGFRLPIPNAAPRWSCGPPSVALMPVGNSGAVRVFRSVEASWMSVNNTN
jgi:restriction system protein